MACAASKMMELPGLAQGMFHWKRWGLNCVRPSMKRFNPREGSGARYMLVEKQTAELTRVRGCKLVKQGPFVRTGFAVGLFVAVLLLAGAPLRSQQQGPTISVNVKMVTMFATVRDKHGALVRNLTKDDFVLQQDGHPQMITYFAPDSDLPLTLGLLVDTSGSQRRVLDQERDASHAFIDHLLREDKDKAFVIHFDREVELLQDLTSSRQKLEASLDQLGRPQFSQAGSGGSSGSDPGNGGSGGSGGGGRGSHGGYGGGGGALRFCAGV